VDVDVDALNFAVITVATDNEDEGFGYLCNSINRFGYEYFHNIGHGVEWNGGDVSLVPGAGQKVNLLSAFIDDYELPDDDVLLFLDGYDTALFTGQFSLLQRWVENFNTDKVTFSAEKICWPDPDMAGDFPRTPNGYNFLNSGCFIGTVGAIKRMFSESVDDDADDQLYYQRVMLSTDLIELDSECLLFQCVAGAVDDIFYEETGAYMINNATGTLPMVIHGNGGENEKAIYLNVMREVEKYYNPLYFREWIGPK
jgi:hypothetical protein